MKKRLLAAQAARQAALTRSKLQIGPADAICPFDLAQRLGVSTRFVQAPSLEGMYSPEPSPTILVGSERPSGRQRFTCGHEIGHHVFGHGVCVDETGSQSTQEAEFLANQFSASLLMPKVAVDAAFSRRGISIATANAMEMLEVAQDLGVGFGTLVSHLELTLRTLPADAAARLRRTQLPALRATIAGFRVPHELFVISEAWGTRSLDLQVGDVALVPADSAYEGVAATLEVLPNSHLRGAIPGVGRLRLPSRSADILVRVSRRTFVGLARYRFLEESPDD